VAETPSSLTVADMDAHFVRFHDYAASVLGHSAATVQGYRDAYRRYRAFLIESGKPEEKIFAIEEWIGWNRSRPAGQDSLSAAANTVGARTVTHVTVNTYWRNLRTFFTHLEQQEGIPSPFRGMKPPTISQRRKPKALSRTDCRKILVAAENVPWLTTFERARAVAIIGVFLYAGLRRRELVNLNWNDVDLKEGAISIWRSKGKGGGADRTVYVGSELRPLLIRYVKERQALNIEIPGFFASSFAGEPNPASRRAAERMSISTLRRIHARVQRAAGVRFSLHALRHSFISNLLRTGAPVFEVASAAGHTNIKTTALYTRVWDEDVRRVMNRVSYR
jgi:integrase